MSLYLSCSCLTHPKKKSQGVSTSFNLFKWKKKWVSKRNLLIKNKRKIMIIMMMKRPRIVFLWELESWDNISVTSNIYIFFNGYIIHNKRDKFIRGLWLFNRLIFGPNKVGQTGFLRLPVALSLAKEEGSNDVYNYMTHFVIDMHRGPNLITLYLIYMYTLSSMHSSSVGFQRIIIRVYTKWLSAKMKNDFFQKCKIFLF